MSNGREEGRGEELARPTGPNGLDKSRQCGGGRSGADAGKRSGGLPVFREESPFPGL